MPHVNVCLAAAAATSYGPLALLIAAAAGTRHHSAIGQSIHRKRYRPSTDGRAITTASSTPTDVATALSYTTNGVGSAANGRNIHAPRYDPTSARTGGNSRNARTASGTHATSTTAAGVKAGTPGVGR